jgi:hypothetical protein
MRGYLRRRKFIAIFGISGPHHKILGATPSLAENLNPAREAIRTPNREFGKERPLPG